MRVGFGIKLIQVAKAVQRPGFRFELPAVLQHVRMYGRDGNDVLQPFDLAENQRAVRPRAGETDAEAITAGFGGKRIQADVVAEL